jgi:hypothetical protein
MYKKQNMGMKNKKNVIFQIFLLLKILFKKENRIKEI